jgi:hypothetical protein
MRFHKIPRPDDVFEHVEKDTTSAPSIVRLGTVEELVKGNVGYYLDGPHGRRQS